MPNTSAPAAATPAASPTALADLRQYAQDAQAMLQDQEIPDTPECHAARARVGETAQELLERVDSPVTIGVVGEYSVGKSLLLGTLLGCPDLLPVEERPTTGNITVLHLTAGERGSPTRAADTTEIRYLSEPQLSRCVEDILSTLISKLDRRHPELGTGAALAGYDPVTDPRGWAPFDSWYPCLWPAPAGGAPRPVPPELIDDAHRDTVVELCRIRDALISQRGRYSVLGHRAHVDRKIVNEALKLPPAKVTPKTPPKLTLQPFNSENIESDKDALSRSFPLIERVIQKVTVSPDHWALGGLLAEHPVQLLDFPGIGAAGSYGRDKSLSRRALVDVHTILLVVLSSRPESKGASEFWDMLLEDGRTPAALGQAALVAANVFDKTHLPSLAAVPGPALPVPELLRHADELNGIHVYGSKFVRGRQDGIVVTSAIPAIRAYELSYTHLSDETRERVRAAMGKLPSPGQRLWEPVAARLESADAGNPWTPRLRSYDDDGGIRHLRDLIEDHVRRNGVAQKLERAERSRRKLDAAVLTLRRQVYRSAVGENAAYREIEETFAELRYLLDRRVRPALHALRRPDRDSVGDEAAVSGESEGSAAPTLPPGLAASAAAVHRAVFQWKEWHHLLERADRDDQHLVSKSRPPTSDAGLLTDYPGFEAEPDTGGADGFLGDADPAEDSSDAFIEHFQHTVREWSANGTDQLREWCQDWAAHWQQEFAPLREWFAEPGTSRLLIELYSRRRGGTANARRQLAALWTCLNTEQAMEKALEKHMPAPDHQEWDKAELEGRFPARAQHALAWHHLMRDLEEHIEERERHPLRIVELRQHTAVAAARTVTDNLDALRRAVTDTLVPLYDLASAALLDENDIVPPRQSSPDDDGDADSPSGGPSGDSPDDGAPGTHVELPIDRLVRTWSID
ncbi:hypothetical protein [Streptomyces sp. NPDC093568]|uniref:hypothetical protein n=1 Tax=Streptomyces sp. NPDC093568 TaxID=3366041 RepID=UPI003825F963